MSAKKEAEPFPEGDYDGNFPVLSPTGKTPPKTPISKKKKDSPSEKFSPSDSFEEVQLSESDVEAQAEATAEKLAKEAEDLAEKDDKKSALAKELKDLQDEIEALKKSRESLITDVRLKTSEAKIVGERCQDLRVMQTKMERTLMMTMPLSLMTTNPRRSSSTART